MTELTETGEVALAAFANAEHEDSQLWERRYKALTLRNGGATYKQIADRTGVSMQMARKDVQAALREFVRAPAEEMIAQQRAILHDLRRAHYPRALSGDPDSTKAVMACLEHEAKLFGLHAPARVNLGITDTEFAQEAVKLIAGLPRDAMADLHRQARTDAAEHGEVLDAEVIPAPSAEEVAAEAASWADI